MLKLFLYLGAIMIILGMIFSKLLIIMRIDLFDMFVMVLGVILVVVIAGKIVESKLKR